MSTVPIPQGAQIEDGPPTPQQPQAQIGSAVPIPQGAQILDSQPPEQPESSGVMNVLGTAYNDVGQTVKGVKDLVDHIVGYKASDNAKLELEKGWIALKSGGTPEAQLHLRNAAQDIVENHPLSQLLKQQWDSSARNRAAVEEDMKKGDHLAVVQHAAGIMPIANMVSDAFDKAIGEPSPENITHAVVTGAMALSPAIMKGGSAATEALSGPAADAASSVSDATSGAVSKVRQVGREIAHGESIAQPGAQDAIRTAVGAESGEPIIHGATGTTVVDDAVEGYDRMSRDLYARASKKSGFNVAQAQDQLESAQARLKLTEGTESTDIADQARQEIEDLKGKIAGANNADPQLMRAAEQARMKFRAASQFKQALVSTTDVNGTVDVGKLLDAAKKLRFADAGDQLSTFMGKPGADQFMSRLEEMRDMGAHAVKVQKLAKWVAKIAGAGLLFEGAGAARGALQ